MEITNTLEEKYSLYDHIIVYSIHKMHNNAMDNKQIIINDVNLMRPYVWKILKLFQSYYDAPLYIKCGIIKSGKIKKEYNIEFNRYYNSKIPTFNPINFIDELSKELNVDTTIFDEIYDAYYRKGKND